MKREREKTQFWNERIKIVRCQFLSRKSKEPLKYPLVVSSIHEHSGKNMKIVPKPYWKCETFCKSC